MQLDGESRIKKILFNEVSFILGVVAVVLSAFIYLTNPQNNTDKIINAVNAELKQHEALQAEQDKIIAERLNLISQGDIKDLKADLLENRTQIDTLRLEIVKLETIIQERFPIKK